MKIIPSPQAMTTWSDRLRREGVTIGFVPTMGALHDGHCALIRAARLQCDALVVSIFINPAQFALTEDLATYPKPVTKDRALCRAEGVDVSFEPNAAAMYPDGFQTQVTVPGIAKRWEGEFRPHHFSGVATVVMKLFGMVRPHLALFGQKDFQQAALVRQLAKDLNLGVAIQVRPTVRERDGLAMSSRNVYLSAENRLVAPVFYQALQAGRQAIERGTRDGEAIQKIMRGVLAKVPAIHIDYLAVCDPSTLEPLTVIEQHAVLLGAIRIGSVRLIDNVVVKLKKQKGRRRPAH
jgi:pantoate--beta-alanine ligase